MTVQRRKSRARAALLAGVIAIAFSASGCATFEVQSKARNIDGSWEAYPQFGAKADPNGPPAPTPIPDPPLKPEYVAAWKAETKRIADATAKGEPIANFYTHCLPDGMPAVMMAMFPMEVLQSEGRVTILEEAYNQVRRIYLNEDQKKIEDAEPFFWGHSVGRWEGNTLIVNTIGVKENVRFRNTPHSDQMRIDERISLINDNFMQDEVTVTDPAYLTEPWKWTWKYRRTPGYKIQEYVCEANREYADPVTGAQKMRVGP